MRQRRRERNNMSFHIVPRTRAERFDPDAQGDTPEICDDCLTAAYDADTTPEKRDVAWQRGFCYIHGDILEGHECAGECECACNGGLI